METYKGKDRKQVYWEDENSSVVRRKGDKNGEEVTRMSLVVGPFHPIHLYLTNLINSHVVTEKTMKAKRLEM